jgi:DNA polymerase III delta subunit
MSWRNPPPCVVIGGDEDLLRKREIHKAVQVTIQSGRPVIWASKDSEVVDALTSASTFGDSALIVCPLQEISRETLLDVKQNQPPLTGLLLIHEEELDEKKFPALEEVHGGYRISHVKPTSKKGLKSLAVRFSRKEAEDLLGDKESLPEKLAEALVEAAGVDLGVLAFELQKAAALARFENKKHIEADHIKKLLRAHSEIDLTPLREALKIRDPKKILSSLEKIHRASGGDPVMLLLRSKGGPADLAVTWLRASLFLKRGGSSGDIAQRLGVPDWSVPDILAALKNWKTQELRSLVGELALVDRGVLLGTPSPWVALQSRLLLAATQRS